MWIVIQAPLVILTIWLVRRRISLSDERWFPILVASAFWIMALATILKRAERWEVSRYRDSWVLLILALVTCLYHIRILPWASIIACAWLGVWAQGVAQYALQVLPAELDRNLEECLRTENNLRQYLITGDKSLLAGERPYLISDVVQASLASNEVRSMLPTGVFNPNPPLKLVSREDHGAGFISNGYPAGLPEPGTDAYGSYKGVEGVDRSGIILSYAVPRDVHGVDVEVAGYPGIDSNYLKTKSSRYFSSIVLLANPATQWRTVTVPLRRDVLKMDAKASTGRDWIAFTQPKPSTRHRLGDEADRLLNMWMWPLASGLAMMLGGLWMMMVGENCLDLPQPSDG